MFGKLKFFHDKIDKNTNFETPILSNCQVLNDYFWNNFKCHLGLSFQPKLFYCRLFHHELFNHKLFNHDFLALKKIMIEEFTVEKSRDEISGIEP